MRKFLIALLMVLATVTTGAQLHDHASGLAHGIPDLCAADPSATIVSAGQSLTISGLQTYSCLGIHGSVTLAADADLKVSTLLVYDDGSLTVQNGAKVTFRDTPLNTATDPEQFGNGLLVLGKLRVNGDNVTPYMRLTSDVQAGATVLNLLTPTSWHAGQRLWVPDTHQPVASDLLPGFPASNVAARLVDQSEVCNIIAVTASTVTCALPLHYSHSGAHNTFAGHPAIHIYPHVANLSRGVVFQSENPNGVRGHFLASQRADVQIRGAALLNMGRTKGVRLDSTTFNSDGSVKHIGTNQIGRYSAHFHHVFGLVNSPDPYQFVVSDSVLEGNLKWGLSVHNTGWGLVQDNVCVVAAGACLVTEDGDEVENTFAGNFVSSVENRAGSAEFSPLFTYDKDANGGTGIRGTGIWLKNMNSRVEDNVVYASRSCLAFYTGNAEDEVDPQVTTHLQRIPKFRGADTTVDANVTIVPTFLLPMLPVDGNECASMSHFGVEVWWTQASIEGTKPGYPFHNLPITNTTIWNVLATDSSGSFPGASLSVHYANAVFDGVVAVNNGGLFAVAVNDVGGLGAGPGASELAHVDARGFTSAWQHGGQLGLPALWKFRDSFYQTTEGFQFNNIGESSTMSPFTEGGQHIWLSRLEWDNVRFVGKAIQPVFIRDTARGLEGTRRIHLNVKNHNGVTGDNFRVYFYGQTPDAPAPIFRPKDPDAIPFDLGCPGVGLTNQQCWDQFHIATLMELAPADATHRPEIDGLIGLAIAELPPPVEPEPTPQPGPTPSVGCPACKSTVTASDGTVWTLGAPNATFGFALLRNGVDTGGASIGFVLATDGFVYVPNGSGAWYRWETSDMFWNGPGAAEPTPVTPPPAPPVAVDCSQTAWVDSFGEWTVVDATHEQRFHQRHRDIMTLPSNGGLACGPSDETLAPEVRTVTPPPPPPPAPVCVTQPITPKVSITVCQ